MILSYLWVGFLAAGLIASLALSASADLTSALLSGAEEAVTLSLTLAGPLCLWSGLTRLMEKSGLSLRLASMLRPFLGRIFPNAFRDNEAAGLISANVTANFLGLGNAATPPGIAAVRRMKALHPGAQASPEMCRLIILNTASIQLIPTTVASVRSSLGAEAPFNILPAVWVTSALSVFAGLLAAWIMEGNHRE